MKTKSQETNKNSDRSTGLSREEVYVAPEKMVRAPEPVLEVDKAELDWHPNANYQLENSLEELKEALRGHAQVLTRSRNSSCVTDAEIHDAIKRLVIGIKQTRGIKILRILATFSVTVGGAAFSIGATDGNTFMMVVGITLSVLLVGIQELLLQQR